MKELVYQKIYEILGQDFVLESPKDKNLAHFATPLAFALAKKERKNPLEIADELANKFQGNELFESVQAVKGYVNFKLSKKFLNEAATKALQEPCNFAKGEAKQEKILLEFVSANPTGPLHIGHARGACYGDSLARIARHLGFSFDTQYYINDAGNQIRLLGLSVAFAMSQMPVKEQRHIHSLLSDIDMRDDYYKGEYIKDLAKEAFDDFEYLGDNAEEFIDEIALWAKDKMLECIKQTLAEANIHIDSFISERSLYPRLEETLQELEKNGGTYLKDEKLWLSSSKKGDEKDRVILKEDGSGTYLAADIVYHFDKMSKNYDRLINIWGADHHGYIARLKAAMEFLGFDSIKLEIILAQMVSLLQNGKPYKMSKRAGNFILMQEVLDEIGADALRFIFLSKQVNTHLEFDVEELKKQDSSNPVYYINYAHARIHQIFAKAGKSETEVIEADLSELDERALNLAFEALSLKAVLNDAFESRALQKLPDYLKALAASLHKFYNETKIVGSEKEKPLLKLLALVALSLRTGLSLMGIEAKKIMKQEQ